MVLFILFVVLYVSISVVMDMDVTWIWTLGHGKQCEGGDSDQVSAVCLFTVANQTLVY